MVKIFAVKILKTCGFSCSVLFYFFPSSLFGWMGGQMIEWKDSREPTSLSGCFFKAVQVMLNVLGCRLTYYVARDKLRPMREHSSVLLYVHGNHEAR